jgi:putative ABC transport system substrate-binding protein
MRRREFITLLGGAATAWPLSVYAQQSKIRRVGALYIALADAELFKKELREGLRDLGYAEGQNIAFEFRSAEGKLDQLPELASAQSDTSRLQRSLSDATSTSLSPSAAPLPA